MHVYTGNDMSVATAAGSVGIRNDNIKFGIEFSKAFLDAREQGNDARVLMNKQNNFAGRMVRLFITPIS